MERLPHGTPREKMVQARDAIVVPAVQANERRMAAESRANAHADVSTIYRLVAELERKGEIDPADFNENWALAERLVTRIGPALMDVLLANPQFSDEKIRRHVERLVDRHLDDCLDSGPAAA